jgi:hypothetical protein
VGVVVFPLYIRVLGLEGFVHAARGVRRQQAIPKD